MGRPTREDAEWAVAIVLILPLIVACLPLMLCCTAVERWLEMARYPRRTRRPAPRREVRRAVRRGQDEGGKR